MGSGRLSKRFYYGGLQKMKPIIYKEKIPSTDKRLGRNINWDSRSANFTFDTSGLVIKDVIHQRLIPILNQGDLASCCGNAGIGNINTCPFTLNSNVYTPDENGAVKLYSDAEKIDGGVGYPPEDMGTSGLSIAKALKNAGLISSYYHCYTLNDTLKALTQYPCLVGISWFSDMFNPDPDGRVHPTGNLVGGHEVEAFQIDTENGRIWCANSWGSDWGVNGTFYLTWADFYKLLSQQGDTIVLIPPTSMNNKIKQLQTFLNSQGAKLTVDGIIGKLTKKAVSDYIGKIAVQQGVEPMFIQAISLAESGLNPFASLYNPPSNSTDRGLVMINNKYHPEVSDAQAYDVTFSANWCCQAIKSGKAKEYWSASMHNWLPMLTSDIIKKYNLQ